MHDSLAQPADDPPSSQRDRPTPPQVLSHSVLDLVRSRTHIDDADSALRWFHLRRDAYIDAAVWDGLNDDQQHLVLARIAIAASPCDRLLSHRTAALAWGIPLIGALPDKVEMLDHDKSTGIGGRITRHRTQNLPRATVHEGLPLTHPVRTAVDVARVHPLATGLAAMDDILHRGLGTHQEIAAEIDQIPRGGRGRQRVRVTAALADGGSESAAESLSRARLFELGMPKPRLQVRFEDADGFVARTDMYWPTADTIGEVDGRVKYDVAPGATGDEAAEVLWHEKRREDRLRQIVHRVVRWGWDDAIDPQRFLRMLTSFGITRRADQRWLAKL